jgi:hypothetical protein
VNSKALVLEKISNDEARLHEGLLINSCLSVTEAALNEPPAATRQETQHSITHETVDRKHKRQKALHASL